MQYSNTTDEVEIRREWEILTSPDHVTVTVMVTRAYGIPVPSKKGEETVTAKFRKMSYEDNSIVQKMSTKVERGELGMEDVIDPNDERMLILKRTLLSWSLDIPVEHDDGWLSDRCFARAINVSAPLMNALLSEYENQTGISRKDHDRIQREAAQLFASESQGVQNASEAVILFCSMGSFWDKFGLNRFDLKNFDYREYRMIRMLMDKEDEVRKLQMKTDKQKTKGGPNTRVSMGGRVGPSRGVAVRGGGNVQSGR